MEKIRFGETIQVLANVGVLASVVFLAVEICGNSDAIKLQEIDGLFDQDQSLSLARPHLAVS